MKPEAPVPSEIALQAACALQRGWSGFHVGECVKPGPALCGLLWECVKPEAPVPSEIALQAARIVQRGWSGFQRGRGCETGSARACFMVPEMGSFGEAGVVWVSWGRGCAAARVVWVSAGAWV